jgi:agmatine deiminase
MTLNIIAQTFTMPVESLPHEGTWLQWPHPYEYGMTYRNRLDATWVAMTKALISGEKVHIIAYNSTEQTRITNLLIAANTSLNNIDFRILPTNDVWIRDNGPIFVRDTVGNLNIEDWGFNGWGGKYNFNLCNTIPTSVATLLGVPTINLNPIMTIEGGAYEIDGNGVFLACKSSILSQSPPNSIRNPGLSEAQAEVILNQYLGVTKFIWLDGYTGTPDITDAHIDGFAKFANDSTLLTMSNTDLLYWGLSANDISKLYGASNVANVPYYIAYLPLTQNNVVTTYGNNLGYKGSYCNYYIGNTAVLVPNYNDPNDSLANSIIQTFYPGRTVIGIDVRNLYENGGMVHCVTQQQPAASTNTGLEDKINEKLKIVNNSPNPFNQSTTISFSLVKNADVELIILNTLGQIVFRKVNSKFTAGNNSIIINAEGLNNGIYSFMLIINNKNCYRGNMVVQK